ncbi:MAG TPA: HD-GYP domain-containing protein [Halanaerobiales bacterium]|nr:HD-GYP domain-containing protein [Halanaerobiales bacterium]
MRLVPVEDIKPDMKLAKSIYHKNNILLNTGVKELHRYKAKLKSIGINYVYIEDKYSADIDVDYVIKDELREKGQKRIRSFMEDIKFNNSINVNKIKNTVSDIVEDILNNSDNIIVNMLDIKNFDDYTFEHSVNVAVYSIILGKSLNFNIRDLNKLGIGAILHDIGKILVPPEILFKEDRLTAEEYEIIKEHSELGYNYIKEAHEVSQVSKAAILSHHERLDGSGYPRKKEGDDIHEYAKIVAITDVYDALTSDRTYRKRWPVHEAISYIMSNSDEKFDNYYVDKFIRNLAIYPNGTMVRLSNGQKAIVKEQNSNYPTRPVLRVIEDTEGNELIKDLDLLQNLNIVIEDVF